MSSYDDGDDRGGLPLWWVLLLFLVVGSISAFVAATVTLYAERRHPALQNVRSTILTIAEAPKTLKDAFDQARDPTVDIRVFNSNLFAGQSGLDFTYAPGEWADAPYLLINRYDADLQRSVSELVDLESQEFVHRWVFHTDPIWRDMAFDSVFTDLARDEHSGRFRNMHAFLSQDGGIVVHGTTSPLLKFGICSELEWANTDHAFHHSIERDADGFYWVPVHLEPSSVDFGDTLFMDDAVAKVSPEGEVVYTRSLAQVFEENELEVFTRGMGHEPEDDPLHLNDIEPVLEDGEIWRKGDLFLSMRNRSMVALYRPETDEIVWWHVGPWIHQHDVNVIDDRRITVFDNAAKKYGRDELRTDPVNGMWYVDVPANNFEMIKPDMFDRQNLKTNMSGRGRVLEDGSIFVEEGVRGRLVITDADGRVRMSFVNRDSNDRLYRLNWSRIVSREIGNAVKSLVERGPCNG